MNQPTTHQPALSDAERRMLAYALDLAQEKIWSEDGFTDEDQTAVDSLRRLADAAVLPAPTDRAAVLREAATRLWHQTNGLTEYGRGARWAIGALRRMAAEEQPAETQNGTTGDKAAALGMTPREYRAASHRAAEEQIREAVQGLYAEVGFRVLDALAARPAVGEQPETQETDRG